MKRKIAKYVVVGLIITAGVACLLTELGYVLV